jgi:hypothetical protein
VRLKICARALARNAGQGRTNHNCGIDYAPVGRGPARAARVGVTGPAQGSPSPPERLIERHHIELTGQAGVKPRSRQRQGLLLRLNILLGHGQAPLNAAGP